MKPLELAYYIINNYNNFKLNKGGITPLKLQKLLYYIKAWGTVTDIHFEDLKFVAWKLGPVNQAVYDVFKTYGKDPISPTQFTINVNKDKKSFIDFVVKNYIIFDAFTLSSMTHKEDPWIKTMHNEIIKDDLMKSYYSQQVFAKNFPLDSATEYYPIKTNMDYSFEMDMFLNSESLEITYPSFEVFLSKIELNQSNLNKSIEKLINALN